MAVLIRNPDVTTARVDNVVDSLPRSCVSYGLRGLTCQETHNETDLAIDTELLERARGEATRTAMGTRSLAECIARHQRARIVESFGILEWNHLYDPRPSGRGRTAPPDGAARRHGRVVPVLPA